MARDAKKSPHGQMAAAIVQIDLKMQLLELIKDGRSHAQIREKMNLSNEALTSLRNELFGELTGQYLEAVDSFRMVTLARYERLFEIADARARGVIPEEIESGERKDPVAALGIPDKQWFDRALAVLAAEKDLMKYDLEQAEKRKQEAGRRSAIEIRSITFTGNDPMAQVALQSMQRDWMSGSEMPEELLLEELQQRQQEDSLFNPLPEDLSIEDLESEMEALQKRLLLLRGK